MADEDDGAMDAGGEENGPGAPERRRRQRQRRRRGKGGNQEVEEELIEPLVGTSKFVVRMRRQLNEPDRAEKFVTQLCELVVRMKDEGTPLVFEDFDISQNSLPLERFEAICSELADPSVRVERFRAFGCPTLDDDVANLIAGWLAGVTRETAPFEMHLSDCAITGLGFSALADVIEGSEAFPPPDPRQAQGKPIPLYLRLENNYIDESLIQAQVDSGLFMLTKKADRPHNTDQHKVRLLVRENGSLQQREGDPPAPEDAPPPKRVHDKGDKGSKGHGRGDSWPSGEREAPWKGRKGKSKGGIPAYQALPAPSDWDRRRGKGDARGSDARGKGADRGPRGRDAAPARGRDPAPARGRASDAPWGAVGASRAGGPILPAGRRGGGERAEKRPLAEYRIPDLPRIRPRPATVAATTPRPYAAASKGGAGAAKGGTKAAAKPASNSASSSAPRGAAKGPAKGAAKGGPKGTARSSSSSGIGVKRQLDNGDEGPAYKRPRPAAGKGKAKGKGAADRAPSNGSAQRRVKAEMQDEDSVPLPRGWEKHWDTEYEMPYYWHATSGEAKWERPDK